VCGGVGSGVRVAVTVRVRGVHAKAQATKHTNAIRWAPSSLGFHRFGRCNQGWFIMLLLKLSQRSSSPGSLIDLA
jgi:hypothetical protein